MRLTKLFKGVLAVSCFYAGIAGMSAIAAPEGQFLVQAAAPKTSQLTEAEIEKALASLQTATDKEDIEGVLKLMAPFVYTELILETDNGSQTQYFEGTEENRLLLKETFARIQEREDLGSQTRIRISPDGTMGIATVSSVRGLTTQDGKRFLSVGDNTFRFGRVGNRLMLVSVTIEGRLSPRPSPQAKTSR